MVTDSEPRPVRSSSALATEATRSVNCVVTVMSSREVGPPMATWFCMPPGRVFWSSVSRPPPLKVAHMSGPTCWLSTDTVILAMSARM
jgi:hypothetical protein